MLQGKRIVLGISGSIAAYKAAMLTRLLIKAGAEVHVVMTPAGKEFITPITLATLSNRPVVSEFFSDKDGTWNSHVDLGLWADAMLIAPATASSIGKMAHGVADNMLITTYLSMKAPVFIAPAMDLDMYAHASTQDNLALLRSRGNYIIEPRSGFLASHLEGKGRMQEPEDICAYLADYFRQKQSLRGRRVLITAGPTYEAIDPVRFIGNQSTGSMGVALADECARRGAQVCLVLGPSVMRPQEANVQVTHVTTAEQMLEACERVAEQSDIAFFTAAVSDYRVETMAQSKIKREGIEQMTISLVSNPDIAATLGASKRTDQYFVCFALETESGEVEAYAKMQRKGMDAVVLNSLQNKGAGFGTTTNQVKIFSNRGIDYSGGLKDKAEVARDIVSVLEAEILAVTNTKHQL